MKEMSHHHSLVLLVLYLIPSLLLRASAFSSSSVSTTSRRTTGAPTLRLKTSSNTIQTTTNAEEIKKWFFLNHNKRSEVSLSTAAALPGVTADIWTDILKSIRVLERDEEMKEYVSVVGFPMFTSVSKNFVTVTHVIEQIKIMMRDSPALMQDSFSRSVQAHNMELTSTTSSTSILLVSLITVRRQPALIDFDDVDEFVPSTDEIVTNDIPDFPFPTVYDFISEINRPPDPTTMLSLRFKYTTKDLKYDLEKMKKKKNPQEVVDSINCKLSRLAQWRDVLTKENEDEPDPFLESVEWGDKVKQRVRSLKALKSDPKKALDTQYDKRKTFVKIIDQWSDRLKRSFKFIYQSQRPPEDFKAPILRSKWRNEIVNASKLFSQAAFLDLKGPDFVVGSPAPLFDPDRYLLWESDYPAGLALFEMLAWADT
jgi:hypothetical protein